jgi:hypothetical protein
MAREFKETAHLKTDLKKYQDNYDSIDWGALAKKATNEKDKEEIPVCSDQNGSEE